MFRLCSDGSTFVSTETTHIISCRFFLTTGSALMQARIETKVVRIPRRNILLLCFSNFIFGQIRTKFTCTLSHYVSK